MVSWALCHPVWIFSKQPFYLDVSLTLTSCSRLAWSTGGERPSGNPGEQNREPEVDFRLPPQHTHSVGTRDGGWTLWDDLTWRKGRVSGAQGLEWMQPIMVRMWVTRQFANISKVSQTYRQGDWQMGINQSDTSYAAVWSQTLNISSEGYFFFFFPFRFIAQFKKKVIWFHCVFDGPVEVLPTVGWTAAAAAAACWVSKLLLCWANRLPDAHPVSSPSTKSRSRQHDAWWATDGPVRVQMSRSLARSPAAAHAWRGRIYLVGDVLLT